MPDTKGASAVENRWLYTRSHRGTPAPLAAVSTDLPVAGSTLCMLQASVVLSTTYSMLFTGSLVTELR